jgi:DNA-binding beta-propeller fold protein YncE
MLAEVHMIRHILLMILLLSAAGAAASADEPLMKPVQTIPLEGVEGRMDHFGHDPQRKRLYLAALGNNTLEVIDLAAGKRIKSIKGLKKPTGIRVLPDSGKVVVASGDDGKVRVYDSDLKLLGEVDGLDDADNVRLDPQGKLAYVGYGDGALAVIDPEQIKNVGEVKLDGHPEAFQLEQNGPRIFVNVPTAHQIAVVDREKMAVIAKWPMKEAEANFPMALDEANHRLFIGCRKPSKVLALDTETGNLVASVDCCGDTDDLFYDAATKRIYLTGGEGCITLIEQTDSDHYRRQGDVPTAPGARTSFFTPEDKTLYVAVPHRASQSAGVHAYRATAASH